MEIRRPSPKRKAYPGHWFQRRNREVDLARAFSSEVDTGSRKENASKQQAGAPFRFHRNGNGSGGAILPRHLAKAICPMPKMASRMPGDVWYLPRSSG
jgi:hypothetical protein